MIKFETIKDLEQQLIRASDAYYNGEIILTDAEFDEALNHLRILNPNAALFSLVGSPVRAKHKIKHINRMGSLIKVHDTEWLKNKNRLNLEVIVMPKLDGISIEVVYEQGIAVAASSRGDGEYGENLLEHVKKMKYFALPVNFSGVLYGEMIMRFSVFNEKYSNDFANPRNLVSGISHRIDASGAEDCDILFYGGYWDSIWGLLNSYQRKEWLCPHKIISNIENYVPEVYADWTDFPLDGLVWWNKQTEDRVAYKFPAEKKEVIVKEIEWNLSKTGNLIPVLIFDTIELAGTELSRCTCNNASWIRDRKISVGSKIVVQKANEIIPNLVDVLTTGVVILPTRCPSCFSELKNVGVHLKCENSSCNDKKFKDLLTFFTSIEIKDFGEAWFKKLYDAGFDDYGKVMCMPLEEYLKLGITEFSAKKFISRIKECWRKCSPIQFLVGLNIPGASTETFKAIFDYYKVDLNSFGHLTIEELQRVPRIGVIAGVIKEEFPKRLGYTDKELFSQYKEEKPVSEELKGKSFCFTGKLEGLKRVEAENMVKLLGGTISSVNPKLSFLVTNDQGSGSSKNKLAQEYGTKIITEQEFLKLINE